jgi:hypothetical protein
MGVVACKPLSRYNFARWNEVGGGGIVAIQVGLSGGPFPLLRVLDEAGAGRMLPDILHSGPKMVLSMGAEP